MIENTQSSNIPFIKNQEEHDLLVHFFELLQDYGHVEFKDNMNQIIITLYLKDNLKTCIINSELVYFYNNVMKLRGEKEKNDRSEFYEDIHIEYINLFGKKCTSSC